MSSTTPGGMFTTTSNDTNITTLAPTTTEAPAAIQDFWIGLMLAVGSSFFIGSSFILQKLGLRASGEREGATRAGEGGHRYLLEWKWWVGLILMILGEACNFVAFAFAPATLVTPLGALSVIFSAILASYFLKERLNLLGKVGCLLCIFGSTIMVIHSPKSAEIQNMEELKVAIIQPGILALIGVYIVAAAVAIIFFAPRWGQSNVVIYVFICATLGALTVTGCKGVGVALKQTFIGDQQFTNWLTYVMLGVVAVNILFQLHFLNKALDTFNTAVVTPTYYVMFTTAVMICSLTLFQEFNKLSIEDIIGDIVGFFVIVSGIFLLNVFKDMKISLKNIPDAKKQQDSVSVEIHSGAVLPTVKKDNNMMLQLNENESENENEDDEFLQCQESLLKPPEKHVYVEPEVTIVQPKVYFGNGHVDHLDRLEERHSNHVEVTHF